MEITLLTVLGSIIVALMTVGGVVLGNIASRLRAVESDLKKERAYNRIVWFWARALLDLYYKWRIEGAPEPPPLPAQEDME